MEDHTSKNIWAAQTSLGEFKDKKDGNLSGYKRGMDLGRVGGEYDQDTLYETLKKN